MALLGYGRVSTDGQSLTAQVAEGPKRACFLRLKDRAAGHRRDARAEGPVESGLAPLVAARAWEASQG